MCPKEPTPSDDLELFRSRLESLIDPRHPLARLAGLIDRRRFEGAFGALYNDRIGRPGVGRRGSWSACTCSSTSRASPTRRSAPSGSRTPYFQHFCGEAFFQHRLPLDRSSMTRWRQRIGPERIKELLAETLAAAERGGALDGKHLKRVTIDTTVQPKAVVHPTDSRLLYRGIERSWPAWPNGTACGCASPTCASVGVPGGRRPS